MSQTGRLTRATAHEVWRAVAAEQSGAVSRAQLVDAGLTEAEVDALLSAGRVTRLHPGIYATFTGPIPARTRAWAALLHAGNGAALAGTTALWLWEVLPSAPAGLTVHVPNSRKLVAASGMWIVRRRRLEEFVHPSAVPRRLRLEDAVLDVAAATADESAVLDVVLRATGTRATTPARLRGALDRRPRYRHRRLLVGLLGDVAEGVRSALEHRYRRSVELAHGLPRGERNRAEPVVGRTGPPRNRYRDVRYRRWCLVVELDGLEAHLPSMRGQDRERDNSVTVAGDHHLEYGWAQVVGRPCDVTAEVVQVLWRQGWRGTPKLCGPECRIGRLLGLPALLPHLHGLPLRLHQPVRTASHPGRPKHPPYSPDGAGGRSA